MIKKSLVTCLILFQFALILNAQKGFQPGYIINNKFDTLRGYVNLRSNYLNSRSCEFRNTPDGSSENYLPGEIFGYRIGDTKFYVSKEIVIDSVPKKIFLEYLVKGIADLYYFKDLAKEYFFVQKNGIITPLTNEEITINRVENENSVNEVERTYSGENELYKGVLRYLFQDSPTTVNRIQATRFEYKSLINVTKNYHNSVCKDWKCIDFTKSSQQRFFIEPVAGYISSVMVLKKSNDQTTSSDFFAGLHVRFKPVKAVTRWNFLLGLNYSENDFTGEYSNHLYTYPNTYLIHTAYKIVRLPVSAEFEFLRKQIKPLVWLSLNNAFLLNADYSVIRTDIETRIPERTPLRKYQVGISGGAGFKYTFKNESYVIFRGGYEYRRPSSKFGWILDYTRVKSILFSAGYGFAL